MKALGLVFPPELATPLARDFIRSGGQHSSRSTMHVVPGIPEQLEGKSQAEALPRL